MIRGMLHAKGRNKATLQTVTIVVILNEQSGVKNLFQILVHFVVVASLLRMTQ